MSARLDSLLDAGRLADIARNDLAIGGISSLDSPATLRAISAAARDADEIEEERQALQARQELLMEQLQAEIDRGDAWVTCFFAGKRSVRCKDGSYVEIRENLGHILADSLDMVDELSFHDVAQYLLDRAAEGEEEAQSLLERMARTWVEGQS
jgi:hypothetical protein